MKEMKEVRPPSVESLRSPWYEVYTGSMSVTSQSSITFPFDAFDAFDAFSRVRSVSQNR